MQVTNVIIIGAGHSGLAMSRALSEKSVDHVVLDKGMPGHAWRTQRWDSLKTLTPNWANGLPGMAYDGPDPDGFMPASELADRIELYAAYIGAPVQANCRVERVRQILDRYLVETSQGPIVCEAVVVATGAASHACVPTFAGEIPKTITQITPDRYKSPKDLPGGNVLVVGASATGVQLARELQLSGRQVTLAVGNHVRLPRRYRGKDIEHWFDQCGIYDERDTDVPDVSRARLVPSPQLVGGSEIDLNALQALGIQLVGRLSAVRNGEAVYSGGLANVITSADLKMHRVLDRIDEEIERNDVLDADLLPDRPEPTATPRNPTLTQNLESGGLSSIVWATGFRPDHSYLDMPVFDRRKQLNHASGVCPVPGLFVLGLPILRRRRSQHISGAGPDTREIAQHVFQHLEARRAA
ncbi:MAG: NAD(P)-binding domain-containing protein [Pseudomonadota bacterium]